MVPLLSFSVAVRYSADELQASVTHTACGAHVHAPSKEVFQMEERRGPEHSYKPSSVEDPVPCAAQCEYTACCWKFFSGDNHVCPTGGADGGSTSSSGAGVGRGQGSGAIVPENSCPALLDQSPKRNCIVPGRQRPGPAAPVPAQSGGLPPPRPRRGRPAAQRGAGDTGSGSSRPVRGGGRAPPPPDPTGCVCGGRPRLPAHRGRGGSDSGSLRRAQIKAPLLPFSLPFSLVTFFFFFPPSPSQQSDRAGGSPGAAPGPDAAMSPAVPPSGRTAGG